MGKNYELYEQEIGKHKIIYHKYLGRLIKLFTVSDSSYSYFLADAIYKNTYYNSNGARLVIIVNEDFLSKYQVKAKDYQPGQLLSKFTNFNNDLRVNFEKLMSLTNEFKDLLGEGDLSEGYDQISLVVQTILDLIKLMRNEPFALQQNQLNYDLLLNDLVSNINSIYRSLTFIKDFHERRESVSKSMNVDKIIQYHFKEIEKTKNLVLTQFNKFSHFNRMIFELPRLLKDENLTYLKAVEEYEQLASSKDSSIDDLINSSLKVLELAKLVTVK